LLWPDTERRGANRPTTGARKQCDACGGVMRFFERYVLRDEDGMHTAPAWVCACGHEMYVRADADTPK
jgi:hypothetical protein